MAQNFSAEIRDKLIHCRIGSTVALKAPVFCFSIMKEPQIISGGTIVRRVAGYAEVALPDIAAGTEHQVVIAYEGKHHWPRNRAWLPLGAYLRVGKICLPLPQGFDLGVRAAAPAAAPPLAKGTLPLVPPPVSWEPSGSTFQIGALSPCDEFQSADALAQRLGLPPLIGAGGLPVTVTSDPTLEPEAYRLRIEASGVTITASSPHGFHNAGITVLNLRETTGGRLPCGTITDTPRFSYRGQHLDSARHFFSVETILRLLDLMALFKLNRFHWHFADDEAFRIEVDCAPDLWRKTAFRGEGELVPGVFGGGIRAGGSYSKADVRRILARAEELHIDVLPEIEVPAHSHAFNKAVPGLRDRGDNGAEESIQGYRDNILNPAVAKTWEFVPTLMDELMDLFPMRMLHLGCDELPPGAWEGSPAVAAMRKEHGWDDPHDVQGWMMERLARHLEERGIRAAAWEEAAKGANGGIGHRALLFSWTGQGPGLEAARRGHDVVMCPAPHTYLDHAHMADEDDWGARWAGIVSLENTIDWDPVPPEAEDVEAHVAGVEGCFWGEFTVDDRQMEPMIAPRILGIACKAWERDRATSVSQIRALAGLYSSVFDRIGWQSNTLFASSQSLSEYASKSLLENTND